MRDISRDRLQCPIIGIIVRFVRDTRGRLQRDHESREPGRIPRPSRKREWTPLARALAAFGDNWTLAIVLELAGGRTRLAQLHTRMPSVSTGVLDRYLAHMVALGLVTRERFREMPPRVELELTVSGRELVPVACAVARWGMRNMWSLPDAEELVDVCGLLRMLPALLCEDTDMPAGSIETILQATPEPARCFFRIEDGRARLVEMEPRGGTAEPLAPAHARVQGSADAWTAALGPAANLKRLRISGDADFATRILTALPRPATRDRARP
jgi:DNA-binding HxlR family transcriptional regulator